MNKKAVSLNFYLILTFLLGFLIFYLSITPGKVVETGFIWFDKIEHFAAYFFLALLTYKTIKKAGLAFFLAGTYGLLIEAIQFTLPYRYFSLSDIVVNYIAAFLVIFFEFFESHSAKTLNTSFS